MKNTTLNNSAWVTLLAALVITMMVVNWIFGMGPIFQTVLTTLSAYVAILYAWYKDELARKGAPVVTVVIWSMIVSLNIIILGVFNLGPAILDIIFK